MSKSDITSRGKLNRRQAILIPASAGLGAVALSTSEAAETKPGARTGGSCSTPPSAVANTQYGKVRGYVSDGVLTFKGIPYGHDTGGENRWLPVKAPKPWQGEYPALIYGA